MKHTSIDIYKNIYISVMKINYIIVMLCVCIILSYSFCYIPVVIVSPREVKHQTRSKVSRDLH